MFMLASATFSDFADSNRVINRAVSNDFMGTLGDLRISDLVTFLTVWRTGSVTAAAREMRVTPSQASKAIARLERHYATKLLTRGVKGMALSDEGRHVAPQIARAVSAIASTSRVASEQSGIIEMTIAGPSYLIGYLFPVIATSQAGLRLRGLEMAPSTIRANVTENAFDIGLVPSGVLGLPPTWTSDEAGIIRKVILGSPKLAKELGPLPTTVERLREMPFVGPASNAGSRFVPIADDCPLPTTERKIVHEVQTFGAAVELAANAGCLTFGPLVGARHLLRSGQLVEIPVEGWDSRETLFLVCNGDVVLDRVRKAVLASVRTALSHAERIDEAVN